MTRPLIILGTGGNALDVLDVVDAINRVTRTWEVVGYLDDSRAPRSEYHDIEILGPLCRAAEFQRCWFVNAIGSDRSFLRRSAIVADINVADAQFATLIHPLACVSSRSKIGPGTVVNFGASIGGEVEIGRHVSVGPGCIVGHNAVVGDFAMLAPGAIISGFVRLGRGCYVGAGAVVKQKITVGESALVGLGAVVVKDVADGITVVGNPAQRIVRRELIANTGER